MAGRRVTPGLADIHGLLSEAFILWTLRTTATNRRIVASKPLVHTYKSSDHEVTFAVNCLPCDPCQHTLALSG